MKKPDRLWARNISFAAFSFPMSFLEIQPLFLLSGGGGIHPGIAKAVNLAIFVGVMYFLVRKPIRGFFQSRLADVRKTLERAAREKDEAAAKMADLDARLDRLDVEIGEIKAQAERESIVERERIQTETQRDLEKVRATAVRDVDAARQIALADLREFTATKSVELAEQMIRRELTVEDDKKLVERAGQELGKAR